MYVRTVFLACMDSRLRGNDAEFAIRRQALARTLAPLTPKGIKPLRELRSVPSVRTALHPILAREWIAGAQNP